MGTIVGTVRGGVNEKPEAGASSCCPGARVVFVEPAGPITSGGR
ncbi:hypothetical protein ACWDRR_04080 [Kitasatospora sp. NPDC003701]